MFSCRVFNQRRFLGKWGIKEALSNITSKRNQHTNQELNGVDLYRCAHHYWRAWHACLNWDKSSVQVAGKTQVHTLQLGFSEELRTVLALGPFFRPKTICSSMYSFTTGALLRCRLLAAVQWHVRPWWFEEQGATYLQLADQQAAWREANLLFFTVWRSFCWGLASPSHGFWSSKLLKVRVVRGETEKVKHPPNPPTSLALRHGKNVVDGAVVSLQEPGARAGRVFFLFCFCFFK